MRCLPLASGDVRPVRMVGRPLPGPCPWTEEYAADIGVSGARIGALKAMEPYKPLFAAMAIVCVGLCLPAGLLQDRSCLHRGRLRCAVPIGSCCGGGPPDCGDAGCPGADRRSVGAAPLPRGNRDEATASFSPSRSARIGGIGVPGPTTAPSVSVRADTLPAAVVRSATSAVENLTCAPCPATVKTAVERVCGVRSVQIDFVARTATAVFDPSATAVDAVAASSADAGCSATVEVQDGTNEGCSRLMR